MKNNRIFRQTQLSLTCWYASIFTGIFALGALLVYEAIAHAHHVTINQELKTVAGTFHDTLESLLIKPNQLEKSVKNIIPNLCLVTEDCNYESHKNRYVVEVIEQGKYYFSFFDLQGNLLAQAGRKTDQITINYTEKQIITIKDPINQTRYRQITLLLHTKIGEDWGYLQIGKSLQDFDQYVKNIQLFLLLGLPLLIGLTIILSWLLAKKAIQPLFESYQQIQQFSSDVAHELRTPLAAIKANIDTYTINQNFYFSDYQQFIATVKRQNQRLINLVNDLLILSRLDQKVDFQSPKNYQVVNLSDLVNDLVEEYSYLALENNLDISRNFDNFQDIFIKVNEEQIYRLVTNLLINAIQNTPKNGKVTIQLAQDKKQAIIQVIDTGIGINEAEQKFIFNRFYRVNKGRSRDKGGSGLGLAIARAIVLNHGGKIEVKSTVNVGSIFTVYLPKIIST